MKIVNEDLYQTLLEHPEKLREILTYANRLMEYETCFGYSFRDNCMKTMLLQSAVHRISYACGIELGDVYDLSVEWLESDDEDDFVSTNEDALFSVEYPCPGIPGFMDVMAAYEEGDEVLDVFPKAVRNELKEYIGDDGITILVLDHVERVKGWYEKGGSPELGGIAFEAYDLLYRSLTRSYASGIDFLDIGDHHYWIYNSENNTSWDEFFPVSPVCDLCGIILYILGKVGKIL